MFDLEAILRSVQKPITYLNNEVNSIHPDTKNAQVKIALGYPDTYEVGMSNLGIRILYDVINSINKVACERFFAPEIDFEQILRRDNTFLFTLESKRSLKEFDFVGFSISSELNYTNVLNLLSLSGIPVYSEEREERDPIILAGGNCSFYPEALSDFIDIWIVGEAEEAIVELVEFYRGLKGLKRKQILKELAKNVRGVYAPNFYVVDNEENVRPVEQEIPYFIERRFVKDFEKAAFPSKWIVPLCQIIHDRISLEIMRGCPGHCLFCQAGFCYKPVRKRSADKIIELGLEAYKNTGYEEISLLSFSAGDHPEIEKIVKGLTEKFRESNVAISFPSLRIDSFSFHLANRISQVKRTGLTFAPETGESLRPFIGKPISDDKLLMLANEAKKTGWKQLKLYFIIGLPGETDQTISEIENLIKKVSRIISVKCSFNVFIPKPHTPFQREKFPDRQMYEETRKRLLKNFSKNNFVRLKFHPYEVSLIECLLSRGNRKIGKIVEDVWKQGGKMENWSECFSFERWHKAMALNSFDFEDYLGDNPLICNRWRHIKASMPFEKLYEIRKNYYKSITTFS
ncbi:MAG: TIGR03960 family B12-binding radical SAM protein [Candidatus Omnitrophica bacterium]|nr:TIGR03960 family B12-binding radical SAM protein [Candidatus Omnitrophota bacterium]MCM8828156.1 TIGR03960 family B12-binding radical SAM protein [Candidatus Omnitrophota bacterium]